MREATISPRSTPHLFSYLSLDSRLLKYHNRCLRSIFHRVDHKVVRSSKIIERASQSRIRHRVTGQWLGENEAETAKQKATCRERERERRKSTGGRKECDRDEDGETPRWIGGSGGGREGEEEVYVGAARTPLR